MQPAHNYKLIYGPRKDGQLNGIISSQYEYLPFMLIDAKIGLKDHKSIDIILRSFDITIATLDPDGHHTFCSYEDFQEQVINLDKYFEFQSKSKLLSEVKRSEAAYFAQAYPAVLLIEFRLIRMMFQ